MNIESTDPIFSRKNYVASIEKADEMRLHADGTGFIVLNELRSSDSAACQSLLNSASDTDVLASVELLLVALLLFVDMRIEPELSFVVKDNFSIET